MQEPINILIASDINYAPYYGVMLASLFKSNPDVHFNIHWFTDGSITSAVKSKFERLIHQHKSQLYIYAIEVDLLKTFPRVGHITLPAYYHLSLAEILPSDVHKIIYLDGDMIINGNVKPLWEIDMSEYACAQVPNCTYFDESYYTRLGYDMKWGYFNNGVSIYNLDYLREINFSKKAIEYVNNNVERIYMMDQDVENALLYEKMLSLPFTYNFQTLFFEPQRWAGYPESFKQQITEAAENPVIVHYCGHLKPWQFRYYLMPYGSLWNNVCRQSMWSNAHSHRPYRMYIKHLLKRIFKKSVLIDYRNHDYITESLKYS